MEISKHIMDMERKSKLHFFLNEEKYPVIGTSEPYVVECLPNKDFIMINQLDFLNSKQNIPNDNLIVSDQNALRQMFNI